MAGKIVAYRLNAVTPGEGANEIGVHLQPEELDQKAAITYCIREAERAAEKLAKYPRQARGPNMAARRDACVSLAKAFKGGLGKDAPVDIDAEITARFDELYSPEGRSTFDGEKMLAELLSPEG